MDQLEKPIPRTISRVLIIFSRIGSFIFHPFFMTTIAAVIVYRLVPEKFYSYSFKEIKTLIGKLALFTILFPFIAVLLFRRSGLVSNTRMHKPGDRIFPLLASLIFYVLAYWLFVRPFHVLVIHSLVLGSCCAVLVIFIINNFYKVSVHTTAAAILPGICLVLMLGGRPTVVPLLMASLIAIIVGLVRWLLGAHTIGQILLGYLIGIFTQVCAYYYFQP